MPHMVQMEFFHVNVSGRRNMDELLSECIGRFADGAKIKTVIRVEDSEELAMRVIKKQHRERDRLASLLSRYEETRGWKRLWWYCLHCRALERFSVDSDQAELLQTARILLHQNINLLKDIAIENPDHSFYSMPDNEEYDLKTAVHKAYGVWLFVFAPNGSLYADNNTLLISSL